jgi:hypothetical protein
MHINRSGEVDHIPPCSPIQLSQVPTGTILSEPKPVSLQIKQQQLANLEEKM